MIAVPHHPWGRLKTAAILALLLGLGACATLPRSWLARGDIAPAPDLPEATRLHMLVAQQTLVTGRPMVGGNAVQLLVNGPPTYAAMAAAIGAAQRRIDMESYEFDRIEGGRFADLLLARRAAGVEVNLLYDAFGSADTPSDIFARLRQGGVQVLEFNPLRPSARVPLDLNRRDHRKLLVVDDAVVITGGVNINHVYLNTAKEGGPDHRAWRDTDIRIVGPVVGQFAAEFAQIWADQHGPALPPEPPLPGWQAGPAQVQAVGGDPHDRQPQIYRVLLAAITLAGHSVHLTTGFFVPPPAFLRALEAAAQRGVDVQLVVPSHSTSLAAIAAGRGYYAALMAAGVHIHERHADVLHAKTVVIDGIWSAVGSSNLDNRSAVLNDELDAVVIDRDFGAQMETLFAHDLADSSEIDPAAWAARPLPERLDEWGAAMLAYWL